MAPLLRRWLVTLVVPSLVVASGSGCGGRVHDQPQLDGGLDDAADETPPAPILLGKAGKEGVALAVDESDVVWGAQDAIYRVAKTGGSVQTVWGAPGLGEGTAGFGQKCPATLALLGPDIIWMGRGGVRRIPKTGGEARLATESA